MDKKNSIIGIALLILGMVLMVKTGQRPPPPAEVSPVQTSPSSQQGQQQPTPALEDPTAPVPPTTAPVVSGHAQTEQNEQKPGEVILSLQNDFVEARFTNYGGAVKEIVLKEFKRTLNSDEPYVINSLRYAPALDLTTYLAENQEVVYEVVPSSDPNSVVFRGMIGDQLEVTRRYTISQDSEAAAPYTIEHELLFRNTGDQPLPMGEPQLNLGTVAPSGNQDRYLQTFGYYNGEDVEFIEQSDFLGGGFAFFKKDPKDFAQASGHIVWASLKNQFFITLLTPQEPAAGYIARPVDFPSAEIDGAPETGLTAAIKLNSFTIPAGGAVTKTFDFYAGPKEHGRLARLTQGQEQAMQFGFFGIISKFLLMIMNGLQGIVGNWGVAIILLTLVVRGALLPITLMSMKSMRKMSKMQEPMKAMKEKFADNPQKQQQMMMELYKLNKINPIAGCLPMILQIPIFFALFYMLRSAAELRFADFLWIQDLSKPDTVATIPNMPFLGDFPLNLLPFVWLASLAYQMWTMPTPTVDNAQMKMMKFMPFIFFPFTYMFSSGLVLYWTVSNVFTIGQQWLAKRGDTDFEVQLPAALKKALEGGPSKSKRKKK